ncbi:DUF4268 domain-containing protein [Deminuibacter soli]|uniref:DUF4268 domain-containing protein n=1 Tax=Deminuibacter soli TaxID=2291815 RepID=A0A3E1NIU4_9BACT|nr:DUF4268 domain-containing protein [Deminuibacter soli]RFM27744.1 DUF4268 domain-containing protein [Deminuibacter soli]
MYTREQASQLRQAFWTAFGHYMQPVPAASGEKINWVNYKTGIRQLYFKMDADRDNAFIGIQITHSDAEKRHLFYQTLLQMKPQLHEALDEEWQWQEETENESGKPISFIYTELDEVNVLNQKDWPALISFFKPRLIALDRFWYDVKDIFELLG